MKGCFIITKKKSRIAARVILIVLVLAFLALAAAVLLKPVRYENEDQQNNFTFPEIVGNGSDGFVAHNKAFATIPATGCYLLPDERNSISQQIHSEEKD